MKHLKLLVIALCVLSASFCFINAGKDNSKDAVTVLMLNADCTHDEASWEITTPPTKSITGLATLVCDECSAEIKQVVLSSLLDVSCVEMVAQRLEPTFLATGKRVYSFDLDDDTIVYTLTLPALNDTDYTLSVAIEPTQIAPGTLQYSYKDQSATIDSVAGTITLNAFSDQTTWSSAQTTPPTCYSMGETTYTLIACESIALVAQDIAMTTHDYAWEVKTAPTASDSGEGVYACQNENCTNISATIAMPEIPNEMQSNENYEFVVATAPAILQQGVGRFHLKNGADYYQNLYVEVEIPALTINRFYIEDGSLYIELSDGSTQNLGVVVGADGSDGQPGADGANGANGVAPEITIGANGNWFIDGEDTEIKAVAEDGQDGIDGVAPEITIGENGNWFIDGEDTEIKATGADGKDGENGKDGKDGNSIIAGVLTSISMCLSTVSMVLVAILFLKKGGKKEPKSEQTKPETESSQAEEVKPAEPENKEEALKQDQAEASVEAEKQAGAQAAQASSEQVESATKVDESTKNIG